MRHLISAYLDDHKTAWAETTLKSEASRLRGVEVVLDKAPEDVYEHLLAQGAKPYSIKTTFIRLCAVESWANLEPSFKKWMKKHANRFKHAYKKKDIAISYSEALERIGSLESPYNEMALGLLTTGLRISEAYVVQDGQVTGKGNKQRRVYGTIKETAPKSTFTRKLKAVGLTPHMLRKLCATHLAEKGASPADLCKIFGWSNIQTAYQYLQPREDERLAALMEAGTKGT